MAHSNQVSFSFHLHYFSAPSDRFLREELSQIFALIPGGAHTTCRAELFMPSVPMSSWCRSPFLPTYQVMWELLQCLRSRAALQSPCRVAGSIVGGDYTIKCYTGFFQNFTSRSCDQCAVGAYKPDTNELNTCSDCPEGRYGLSGSAQSNISHCPKCPSGYYGPTMRAITW